MAERLSLRVSRKTATLSSVPMTASRSTNGARIFAAHADVEVALVVRDPRRRLHLRRCVVGWRRFVKRVDDRGVFPAGVVELSVDRNRAVRAMHGERRRFREERERYRGERQQEQAAFQHFDILRTNVYVDRVRMLRNANNIRLTLRCRAARCACRPSPPAAATESTRGRDRSRIAAAPDRCDRVS